LELRDKVADVTGGNRGIGRAVACQLAKERVDVALVARDRGAFELPLRKSRENQRVKGWIADTGDDTGFKSRRSPVLGEFGRIDILVNRAAAVGGQGKPPMLAPKSPMRRFSRHQRQRHGLSAHHTRGGATDGGTRR
jgi:NAD(P)-dependent dehydrogenase (short-subunit alcohol dehydrogenase family)